MGDEGDVADVERGERAENGGVLVQHVGDVGDLIIINREGSIKEWEGGNKYKF